MKRKKNIQHNSLIIILVLIIAIAVFVINLSVNSTSSSKTASIEPTNGIQETRRVLPEIIYRNKKTNYSSWSKFVHNSGYNFSYPPSWFISKYNDTTAVRIQNWDPNNIAKGGATGKALTGMESKWDVDFNLKYFSTLDDVLQIESNPDVKIDRIEKSVTLKGLDCYFIQGFNENTQRGDMVAVIITKNNQYFTWTSSFSGDDNAEILKEIVESLD
jgi:hypothetical protein